MKKTIIASLIFSFFFMGIAFAQEETSALLMDETITAETLNIKDPSVLPDSPFYIFKEIGRDIQSLFTFGEINKLKLKEKFANEKIIEVQKLIEKNAKEETVSNALGNYQKELENIQQITSRIQEENQNEEKINSFLDKFVQTQTLQQRIMQKLEEQVPEKALIQIREAKALQLENFGEVMTKLENKNTEMIQERLQENLKAIEGSEFQEIKNLEMLNSLIEKAPQEAKTAIQNVQLNLLNNLGEKIENLSQEGKERFQEYIENSTGNKEIQLEILDSLKNEATSAKDSILQFREKVLEKASLQIQNQTQSQNQECINTEKPASGFCENGRIIIKRSEAGCITNYECVVPNQTDASQTMCITLWDPVCGTDGRTYSNECFANVAGVRAASKGVCEMKNQEQETNQNINSGVNQQIQYQEMEQNQNNNQNVIQKNIIEPIKGMLSQ